NDSFNFWRCWESSGGICIGVAYGTAYFLVNRRMSADERAVLAARRAVAGPNFEWLLIFTGLAASLSLFTRAVTGGIWGSFAYLTLLIFAAAYYLSHRADVGSDGGGRQR